MKTVLIPTDRRKNMGVALQTALMLARCFDSYIEGFALRSRINDFASADVGGGFAITSFKDDAIAEARKSQEMFEAFMQEQGVPRASEATAGLSFGWLDDAPEGEGAVGFYGRIFDLIVFSRPDETFSGLDHRALESGLFESGRPILLAPPTAPRQIGANILIAWNGSTEQARTIAFAMPLLHRAERVTVLTIPGGAAVPGPSAEQATRSLQRNGIRATLLSVELDGRSTGETILAASAAEGCDLLVKGAYTQSRLRQMIFGGATSHILASATIPVLMAH
jgi:nucleotide-binding universal stress UspA family protein